MTGKCRPKRTKGISVKTTLAEPLLQSLATNNYQRNRSFTLATVAQASPAGFLLLRTNHFYGRSAANHQYRSKILDFGQSQHMAMTSI